MLVHDDRWPHTGCFNRQMTGPLSEGCRQLTRVVACNGLARFALACPQGRGKSGSEENHHGAQHRPYSAVRRVSTTSERRSDTVSNTLKYQDLSHTERLEYERIVSQGPSSGNSTQGDGATPHDKRQPARPRSFLASAPTLGAYVARLFRRAPLTPHAATGWSALE